VVSSRGEPPFNSRGPGSRRLRGPGQNKTGVNDATRRSASWAALDRPGGWTNPGPGALRSSPCPAARDRRLSLASPTHLDQADDFSRCSSSASCDPSGSSSSGAGCCSTSSGSATSSASSTNARAEAGAHHHPRAQGHDVRCPLSAREFPWSGDLRSGPRSARDQRGLLLFGGDRSCHQASKKPMAKERGTATTTRIRIVCQVIMLIVYALAILRNIPRKWGLTIPQ